MPVFLTNCFVKECAFTLLHKHIPQTLSCATVPSLYLFCVLLTGPETESCVYWHSILLGVFAVDTL